MSPFPPPDVSRSAVVGLGQMGRGIARNLDSKGMLVAAFDRRQQAIADAGLSERVERASAEELTGLADVLLFVVPTTLQIAEFFEFVAPRPGTTVIDLTTSSPMESRALSEQLAEANVSYIDAAMTGGAAGADEGSLTLMAGGRPADIEVCQPIFDGIASNIFHLGGVGAGHAMKLVHNLILHSSFLATCEGLRLAQRVGIEPDKAVEVLNAGNARSFVTEVRFPRDILSGAMNTRSRVSNLEKDIGLALELAVKQNAPAPIGTVAHGMLEHARIAGHSDKDFSWLFPLFEELT